MSREEELKNLKKVLQNNGWSKNIIEMALDIVEFREAKNRIRARLLNLDGDWDYNYEHSGLKDEWRHGEEPFPKEDVRKIMKECKAFLDNPVTNVQVIDEEDEEKEEPIKLTTIHKFKYDKYEVRYEVDDKNEYYWNYYQNNKPLTYIKGDRAQRAFVDYLTDYAYTKKIIPEAQTSEKYGDLLKVGEIKKEDIPKGKTYDDRKSRFILFNELFVPCYPKRIYKGKGEDAYVEIEHQIKFEVVKGTPNYITKIYKKDINTALTKMNHKIKEVMNIDD